MQQVQPEVSSDSESEEESEEVESPATTPEPEKRAISKVEKVEAKKPQIGVKRTMPEAENKRATR